jgi:hypothetical protein
MDTNEGSMVMSMNIGQSGRRLRGGRQIERRLDLFLCPFQETDRAYLAALEKFEQGASVTGTPISNGCS